MPEEDQEDSHNVTDTNSAPANIDEDGEPADETPLIQKLVVEVSHLPGADRPQADISALIHTSTGLLKKRLIVTGDMTAARLAEVILGIAKW